jgi:hypothetical protein
MKYSAKLRSEYKSIDSSRDLYSSIKNANYLLRKVKALERGVSWNENPTGWAWIRLTLTELLESLGFELWVLLRKMLFGLSVLVGWILVLGLVIVWLGGFK